MIVNIQTSWKDSNEHLAHRKRTGDCDSPQDIPCYFFADGCYANHFCGARIKIPNAEVSGAFERPLE